MPGRRRHLAAVIDLGRDLVRRLGTDLSDRLAAASHGRLLATLAGAAAAGLAAGTVLHSVINPRPAEPPAAALHVTVAQAHLDLATHTARALLEVTLVTARADVRVVSAAITGVGVAGPASLVVPGSTPARPAVDDNGHLARLQISVPLHCNDSDLGDVSTPTLTLRLGRGLTAGGTTGTTDPTTADQAADGTTTATTTAADWVLPGGLCQSAYQLLPQGWQLPAVLDSFTVDPARPEDATAVVSGLPVGRLILTVAPFRFPVQTRAEPHADGTATIHLTLQGCPPPGQGPVAGFALLAGAAGERSDYHYVPGGLAMSRWQLAFSSDLCP